ncbi:MAG TPA: 2-oxoglutarate dehydrogenase E1 component, partial [Hyphomonas sp.]|nr:2-oxoglutarate dehydrogenase E1 component [Hyphomonas sp.]
MADDGSPVNGPRGKDNAAMLETAFLYGGSAHWIEQMQAAYAKDPSSVPESWRVFFAELGDEAVTASRNAQGASWKRQGWPREVPDEQIAAFDGNWAKIEAKLEKKIKAASPAAAPADIAREVTDSIRAIMMIRAYRI